MKILVNGIDLKEILATYEATLSLVRYAESTKEIGGKEVLDKFDRDRARDMHFTVQIED